VSQNIRGPGCWICAVVSGFVAARRPPTGWRAACLMCFEIELLWLVSGDRHIEEKKKRKIKVLLNTPSQRPALNEQQIHLAYDVVSKIPNIAPWLCHVFIDKVSISVERFQERNK
jgi:hypothetical protein